MSLKKGPQIPLPVAVLIILAVLVGIGVYYWRFFHYIEPGRHADMSHVQRPKGATGGPQVPPEARAPEPPSRQGSQEKSQPPQGNP